VARPRITAVTRVHRLLAVLQWTASHPDGVPIDELCDRFGLAPGELVKELEMAAMVGADSVHYDEMPFEVIVEDGRVWVRLFSFGRPMRLTPAEGLALVAAAEALVGEEESADSALGRALTKLAHLLGIEPGQAVDVDLDPEGGPVGRLLVDAARRRRRVRFTYWTYGRDVVGTRTVEPWQVYTTDGSWYLAGHDVDAGAERRFRLDRTEGVEVLDDAAVSRPPPDLDVTVRFTERGPLVVLDLPADARWVAEAVPVVEARPGEDGRVVVTLAVAGRSWLERLLLRLGPDARIVEIAPELGDDRVLATAAAKVLARYRDVDAQGPR
jgi:predicted DNA-binding transcriptional regulator YafY